MLEKLIIFLIRRRLGVKKYECFGIVGNSEEMYYFTDRELRRVTEKGLFTVISTEKSKITLNQLLNDDLEIQIFDGVEVCH
jgi:hypothetical protein